MYSSHWHSVSLGLGSIIHFVCPHLSYVPLCNCTYLTIPWKNTSYHDELKSYKFSLAVLPVWSIWPHLPSYEDHMTGRAQWPVSMACSLSRDKQGLLLPWAPNIQGVTDSLESPAKNVLKAVIHILIVILGMRLRSPARDSLGPDSTYLSRLLQHPCHGNGALDDSLSQ